MRKIKEVLRLKWLNQLSDRKIAQSCNISRPAVVNTIDRAEQAGLSWPLPDTLTDVELERLLFPTQKQRSAGDLVWPDWSLIRQELQKKNVTLFLLWQEYREHHPKGYQYSWFCDQYRSGLGQRDLSMRQTHRAGEKLFVDYAGQTMPVINPGTGEIRSAQIFVAVLGASNYSHAEATWTQSLADWIGSHLGNCSCIALPPASMQSSAPSAFGVACQSWLFLIICVQASPKPTAMNRISIPPVRTWQPIMAWRLSPRVSVNLRTIPTGHKS
jgi:hypothetical protein